MQKLKDMITLLLVLTIFNTLMILTVLSKVT